MGVDIAQAALAAGHAVVATGRNTEAVTDAVGGADDLLVVELDITSLASAEAAVDPGRSLLLVPLIMVAHLLDEVAERGRPAEAVTGGRRRVARQAQPRHGRAA